MALIVTAAILLCGSTFYYITLRVLLTFPAALDGMIACPVLDISFLTWGWLAKLMQSGVGL